MSSTYALNNRMANGNRNPQLYYLLGEYLHNQTRRTGGYFPAGHKKVTRDTGIARSTHGDFIAIMEAEGFVEVTHVSNRRFVKWVGDIERFRASNGTPAGELEPELYARLGELFYANSQSEDGAFFFGPSKRRKKAETTSLDDYVNQLAQDGFMRVYAVDNRKFAEWSGDIENFRARMAS